MSRTLTDFRIEYAKCASAIHEWFDGDASQGDVLEAFAESRASNSPEVNQALDELLLRRLGEARSGLTVAQEAIASTQEILNRYGAAPLMPGIFVGLEKTRLGDFAVVSSGGGRRVVALADDVDGASLRCGDGVYLSTDQSVLFAVAPSGNPPVGEMASFERYTPDGRIVLKVGNDEQMAVQPVSALGCAPLHTGDMVRWDRGARLCIEKMDDAPRNPYMLEEIHDLPMSQVGGQKANMSRLRSALVNSLLYPERAKRFGLSAPNSLLLYGPPGNGKTYLSRAVFSEIRRLSSKKVVFSVVKASQWESPWVGETQRNISSLFAAIRKAAADGAIAALFIDEIDAVGRTRGGISGHHSDKALNTLLTELSGFEELPNISIIAAVNRKDLLDSALLSRFGTEVAIRRPDIQAAQEIFSIHLDENQPYINEGARQEMIDLAISRLYAPNADTEVSVLKLRDGKTRTVAARELVSARLIRHIAESARRRALQRWNDTEVSELRVDDMVDSVDEARERLVDTLTPTNAHNHLESLATDDVVVAVEPIRRRIARAHRYVSLA